MNARNHGPIELSVNEWIELTTPDRVRNVPKSDERERDDHEQDVPDLQHPSLLLDHHRVQERRRGEPRHERRVLDRIPCVVPAPADLDVRPVAAEELADPERGPGEQRPAARRDEPALVELAGEQRADRERERHREPDVARGRGAAGGRACTGSGGSESCPRRPPAPPASRTGSRPRRRGTRRTSTRAPKTGTTQTMRSRAHARFRLTAAAPNPVRTSSQSRSEPSCPPQNAEIVYGVGSALLVVRATYSKEKSFRRSAAISTAGSDRSRDERRDERVLRGTRQPASPEMRRVCARDERVDGQSECDEERGATQLRHGRVSGGVAALLRRVLRRALRDHRARLGDECAAFEPPVDDDVAPDLEEIRNRARIADCDASSRRSADVLRARSGGRLHGRRRVTGPNDDAGQLHRHPCAPRARSERATGCRRPRSTCTGGTRRAPPPPRGR